LTVGEEAEIRVQAVVAKRVDLLQQLTCQPAGAYVLQSFVRKAFAGSLETTEKPLDTVSAVPCLQAHIAVHRAAGEHPFASEIKSRNRIV
jgi:hypothetical protein